MCKSDDGKHLRDVSYLDVGKGAYTKRRNLYVVPELSGTMH